MGKVGIIVAIVCTAFVIMAVSWKEDSSAASRVDALWTSKGKQLEEEIENTQKEITLSHVKQLQKEDPRIHEARSKPKVLAEIRKTVDALDLAYAEILAWDKQVMPLLKSKSGLALTWSPQYIAAADKIFFETHLPNRAEVEENLGGLVPYLPEVRKMKGIETAPLIDYDPLKLGQIEGRANLIHDEYRKNREALFGLLAISAGKKPDGSPSLLAAINAYRQMRAAADALRDISQ